MKAGRELDGIIAEKIMGCGFWLEKRGEYTLAVMFKKGVQPWDSLRYDERASNATRYTPTDASTAIRTGFFGNGPAEYSADIAEAWQLVRAVQEREPGWRFTLLGGDHQDGRWFGWHAEFFGHVDPSKNYGQRHGEAYADTAPLAICLASLKACGVEIESNA